MRNSQTNKRSRRETKAEKREEEETAMESTTLSYLKLAAPLVLSILAAVALTANGCFESHPESVKVTAGEWANFSCTINCSNTSLYWRLDSPRMGEVDSRFSRSRKLKSEWRQKKITIRCVNNESVTKACRVKTAKNEDYESVMIQIRASSQMNGAVIQCAAIDFDSHVRSLYSKFAVLQVEPAPESASEPMTQESSGEEPATQESTGYEETTRTTGPPTTPPPSH